MNSVLFISNCARLFVLFFCILFSISCAHKTPSEAVYNNQFDEINRSVEVRVSLEDHNSEQASAAAVDAVRARCPESKIVILSAEDRVVVDQTLYARSTASRRPQAIRPQRFRYFTLVCRD